MMTELQWLEARAEDMPKVAQLEKEIFSEPWKISDLEEARARKENVFLVAVRGEEVVAYGILYVVQDEGEIPTIATNSKYLRQGVGEALLQKLLDEGKKRGVNHVYLEVRVSNLPAQKLYEKMGFQVDGIRKNFYRFPTEDAQVMSYHTN